MGHLIDSRTAEGREGRRLIVGTVLATDMSWHFEWVERFGRAMRERKKGTALGPPTLTSSEATGNGWVLGNSEELEVEVLDPEEADKEDRLFLCQALMKCGDISNPVSILVFELVLLLTLDVGPASFGLKALVVSIARRMGNASFA